MKTNIYRCLEPCDNCPLMDDGKKIRLSPERVKEIKQDLERGENFVCHKTIYDEGMEDSDRRMCYGAYRYLKRLNKPNQIMQLAERLGVE